MTPVVADKVFADHFYHANVFFMADSEADRLVKVLIHDVCLLTQAYIETIRDNKPFAEAKDIRMKIKGLVEELRSALSDGLPIKDAIAIKEQILDELQKYLTQIKRTARL